MQTNDVSFILWGPALPLFEKPYFEKVHAALKPDGIMCSQGQLVIDKLLAPCCDDGYGEEGMKSSSYNWF